MKEQILVIHEKDLDDNERSVIGVSDSVDNALKVIKEYYGDYTEVRSRDMNVSNLEFEKLLELFYTPEKKATYQVLVWTEWFSLNEA